MGVTAGLLGAYGISKQAALQKGVNQFNIGTANAAAQDALTRGNYEAGLIRTKGSQLIGKQQVAYAASGVDASSGTPLQVMADTRLMSELDAQTAKNNAAREAWGYKVKAQGLALQGQLDQQKAQWDEASTVLNSAANAAATGMSWAGKV